MDETVNDAPLFEASDVEPVANEPAPEQAETEDSSAVEEANEQTASENEATTEPAATTDAQTGDAIDEFLAKKGIKADDPNAVRKIADMYRNAEKGFYNKSQEAAQLQRRLAEAQPRDTRPDQQALSEVRAMRIELDTNKWKAEHKLSPEDEQKMIDYVTTPLVDRQGNAVLDPVSGAPLTRGLLVNNGALTLDDVYKLAGCGVVEVDNLKQNLREEVMKEMEARQAAKRPSASATNSTQFGEAKQSDPFLDGLFGE